jgi:glycine dehydrogenase subunit 2
MDNSEPLLFEISNPGAREDRLPACDVPEADPGSLLGAENYSDAPPPLPEVSELTLVRHFTRLSRQNFSIDTHFYPLGSCTMKYNPKVNERAAAMPGFAHLHPHTPENLVQGMLELQYVVAEHLREVAGLHAVSLQPAAGAQGELTGLMVIVAEQMARGERRTHVLIPDNAHGTNPASCTICGLKTVTVASTREGVTDLDDMERKIAEVHAKGEKVAALMVTNPNTAGKFDPNIERIARRIHEIGARLYLDGANMNAIVGVARPGDFGVDVMHYNVHKTFSTPHGCGGPGAGPIAVVKDLEPFLPKPTIVKETVAGKDRYRFDHDRPKSIGKVRSFWGQSGVLVRAFAYLRAHGPKGLKGIGENALLAANYLRTKLEKVYPLQFPGICGHEFVLSAKSLLDRKHVSAMDVAKRLIDYGFHPPTVYFPLIVPEALMIEPTETESKDTLDRFVEAMKAIAREAEENPEIVRSAPHGTFSRPDEVRAARKPDLRWEGGAKGETASAN